MHIDITNIKYITEEAKLISNGENIETIREFKGYVVDCNVNKNAKVTINIKTDKEMAIEEIKEEIFQNIQ